MKTTKIAYYVSTGLLTALMLFSASMYFLNYADVQQAFTALGFPTYIIYPLGVAKILGLVAIWTGISPFLKEWAYAGFFYNALLATSAHLAANDGEFAGGVIAIVLVAISYYTSKRI